MKPTSFAVVYRRLCEQMKRAPVVKTERWQGIDASKNPSMATRELRHVYFEVDLGGVEDLNHWQRDIGPNLPWADDHFLERVGGSPLNPGREWENWPWATSADKFRDGEAKIFNHTYAERLWPKWPRRGSGGDYSVYPNPNSLRRAPQVQGAPMRGISGTPYGDLQDLVEFLTGEPHTRQAYFGMWHPEDNGRGDGGRKPCSLGWQFLVRDDRIDVTYVMRSVDLRRHFRDDCYLAVRLLLWVLDRCREVRPEFWIKVKPGNYDMLMTSLHVFANDHAMLVRGEDWDVTR